MYSGRDSILLLLFPEREAHYNYYKHGPLAQTELGQLRVQKQDYAYNLQGWLKAVNPAMSGTLTNGTDTTEAYPVAQDAYAFSLHYFKNDYKAIGYTPQATSVLGALNSNAAPLYNGNIAAMAVSLPKLGATKLYNYHYDQLNRIVAMDMYNGLTPAAGTFTAVNDTSYKERVSYDPNGNILSYWRNGDLARPVMDRLSYFYKASTNQLHKVTDAAADAAPVDYSKYNDLKQGQANNNYQYDAIGNLVKDNSEGITDITWSVYGKILTITKSGSVIRYVYDATGNRIMKQTTADTTVYVRDSRGNVLSVYSKPAAGMLEQTETHLYGGLRLGIATKHLAPDSSVVLSTGFGSAKKSIFIRGGKLFELNNHLDNVLVTVSDRRIQNSSGGTTVDFYTADVVTANDYYPYGMLMPGRKYTISNLYHYGFNGKENDNDVKGEGNLQDYGMRVYDSRMGRFLSVDPLTKHYPWYTPYSFAGNKPIWATDLDGLEENTTSTYVKKPFIPPLLSPTFNGIITVTDATAQAAHQTFKGNYAQLRKADPTGLGPSIVNQISGTNYGTSTSALDIKMTGTRSEVSKTWKGTDIKYFVQYSYSFTSNNVTEQGTFETNVHTAPVSARVWDPLAFLILNKIVSSIVISVGRLGGTAATEEMVTLYRSISRAEMESIKSTRQLSFAEGQMEVKQFWQTQEGLGNFNKTGFAGEFNLEIKVPKSMLGNGKPQNTSVQVDESFGPTATIDNAAQLSTINQSIQSIKITPIKTP